MDLNRRSFLKAIGITSAGIVLPSFDILMPSAEVIPEFRMRPMVYYDVDRLIETIRYDVYDGKNQLFVAARVEKRLQNKHDYFKIIHKPMVVAIKNTLWNERIPLSTLRPLAIPSGYHHPDWFKEILNV